MAGENLIKLKIDNVVKEYEGRNGKTVALNGVNLDIKENEFICVVGPSGCGKSTLLNIIAGLHEATSGEVLVAQGTKSSMLEDKLFLWVVQTFILTTYF